MQLEQRLEMTGPGVYTVISQTFWQAEGIRNTFNGTIAWNIEE